MQPLLDDLCAGAGLEDLPAALAGLLTEAPHVRSAALDALPSVPLLSQGLRPFLHKTDSALGFAI